MKNAQFALHACAGVIKNPSSGFLSTYPVWCCHLLVSHWGKSADAQKKYVSTQERFFLQCRGIAVAQYCSSNLEDGDLVHAVAKLIHKPVYNSEHSLYLNESELLISDSTGHIAFVKRLREQ